MCPSIWLHVTVFGWINTASKHIRVQDFLSKAVVLLKATELRIKQRQQERVNRAKLTSGVDNSVLVSIISYLEI